MGLGIMELVIIGSVATLLLVPIVVVIVAVVLSQRSAHSEVPPVIQGKGK